MLGPALASSRLILIDGLPLLFTAIVADSFESLTEGYTATFSPDVAGSEPITTTVDSVTGPGSAVVNADGFRIDVDLDPNSGGGELAIAYTSNGASATITVSILDVDIEASLTPSLVQIDTSDTIADAWADAAMPTLANFSPAASVLVEGSINGGAYSEANMSAALTEGQTVTARVTVTDDVGNTEIFGTNTITVAGVGATAPANDGTATLVDAPSSTGDQMTLDITALPDDGGATISGLEYQLSADDATWGSTQGLSGTGTGERTITAPDDETLTYLRWRAVNSVDPGDWHTSLSATPSYTFTLSDTSGDIEWTGVPGEYTVTITAPSHYAVTDAPVDTADFASGAVAIVTPAISGNTSAGSLLSCRPALFAYDKDDVPTITGKFQKRTTGSGDPWADISGTTATITSDAAQTYFTTSADEGEDIRFLTTATSDAGAVPATSGVVAVDAGVTQQVSGSPAGIMGEVPVSGAAGSVSASTAGLTGAV